MRYEIESYKVGGLTVRIGQDDSPQSPEEWGDTEVFLGAVSNHRRFYCGREDEPAESARRYVPWGEGPWEWDESRNGRLALGYEAWFEDEADMRLAWEEEHDTGYAVFPVELVDYGANGQALRECTHREADGYIFVKVPWSCDLERVAYPDFDAKGRKDAILADWNQYLGGEVYMVDVEDSDGESLESCCGFYGLESAKEWAKEVAEHLRKQVETVQAFVIRRSSEEGNACKVAAKEFDIPVSIGLSQRAAWIGQTHFADDSTVIQVNLINRAA